MVRGTIEFLVMEQVAPAIVGYFVRQRRLLSPQVVVAVEEETTHPLRLVVLVGLAAGVLVEQGVLQEPQLEVVEVLSLRAEIMV